MEDTYLAMEPIAQKLPMFLSRFIRGYWNQLIQSPSRMAGSLKSGKVSHFIFVLRAQKSACCRLTAFVYNSTKPIQNRNKECEWKVRFLRKYIEYYVDSHGSVYLSGQRAPAGKYWQVGSSREVTLKTADLLPASLDGRVIAFNRLTSTWSECWRCGSHTTGEALDRIP